MESIIEKAIGWFKDISEATKELTSGNVSHKACAIRGVANRSAEYLEKHKRNLSVIEWQIGEPTTTGHYLVQTKDDGLQISIWSNFVQSWSLYSNSEIIAWCKLSDIKPYKEETK